MSTLHYVHQLVIDVWFGAEKVEYTRFIRAAGDNADKNRVNHQMLHAAKPNLRGTVQLAIILRRFNTFNIAHDLAACS